MNTKLTLSVKADTVQKAKTYASENDTTVSAVFEDFITYVTTHNAKKSKPLSSKHPIVVRLFSNIKKANRKKAFPLNFDYKEELTKSLSKKYRVDK